MVLIKSGFDIVILNDDLEIQKFIGKKVYVNYDSNQIVGILLRVNRYNFIIKTPKGNVKMLWNHFLGFI